MDLSIEPTGQVCGARITGVDLAGALDDEAFARIRAAWLEHRVIHFPDQRLTVADLERFALGLGPFGEDPYIAPGDDSPHVIEVKRAADEKSSLFAESWHSDWSFLPVPPAGTLLYAKVIPPVGGDTLYADLHAAFDALPAHDRAKLETLRAVHSARLGYAKSGRYGERDKGRSMRIRPDDSAMATHVHPLVRTHPETGRKALFVSPAYTIGIEGMDDHDARSLLERLFAHLQEPRFIYRHRWAVGMLTLWDNRAVNHRATGGYDGHARLLQRITIAERSPAFA